MDGKPIGGEVELWRPRKSGVPVFEPSGYLRWFLDAPQSAFDAEFPGRLAQMAGFAIDRGCRLRHGDLIVAGHYEGWRVFGMVWNSKHSPFDSFLGRVCALKGGLSILDLGGRYV